MKKDRFLIEKNPFGYIIKFKLDDKYVNVLELSSFSNSIEVVYPTKKQVNSKSKTYKNAICSEISLYQKELDYFDDVDTDDDNIITLQETHVLNDTYTDTLVFKNFKLDNVLKSGKTPSLIRRIFQEEKKSNSKNVYNEVFAKCKDLNYNYNCYFSIRYIEEKEQKYDENGKKLISTSKDNIKYFWISICRIIPNNINTNKSALPVVFGVKLKLDDIIKNKEFQKHG